MKNSALIDNILNAIIVIITIFTAIGGHKMLRKQMKALQDLQEAKEKKSNPS